MAQWPPTEVTAIPAPPDATYPSRDEVGPLKLVGPTAENQQPNALDVRTETIRQLVNTLAAAVNVLQENFLDIDGADAPITGSVQGSYFMRGDMDLGGFKIVNVADATIITDIITVQQIEAIQFSAEDDLEQILDTRVVFQDGTAPMISNLPLGTGLLDVQRVTNLAAAAIGTDAVRKDTFDA